MRIIIGVVPVIGIGFFKVDEVWFIELPFLLIGKSGAEKRQK